MEENKIQIFQTADGSTQIAVRFEQESVWLTQRQMSEVFDTTSENILMHLKNIFQDSELEESSTTKDFLVVRTEGKRQVERNLKHYNLDAIISVGYRVSSKRAVQFRQWATQRLKEYLVQGYALNQQRLEAQQEKMAELRQAIALSSRLIHQKQLSTAESQGILAILEKYSHALTVLDDYDHQRLQVTGTHIAAQPQITYDEAIAQIKHWRSREGLSGLFGNEKDDSFKSSLETIYQTFDGKELYPSIEEKAANLLYFIVKNHSFTDGNKRIAAAIFVWFLQRNNFLYNDAGEKRIADNALVAFTLLIAESKPDERDIMVKVIINLINGRNTP
jgi:prophage maintenance system killer protein